MLDKLKTPKVELEQYQTPPHIAAHMLWAIQEEYNDIRGKIVLDLGCGCGTLAIGCILLGAAKVIGVDIDREAIDIAVANATRFGIPKETLSFLHQDVSQITSIQFHGIEFDAVIMNPPFGIQNQPGIDSVFVQKALLFAGRVYSMHKASTRDFWLMKAKEWNVDVNPIYQIKFNIAETFKFHRKESVDINVCLILFKRCKKNTV